jgi:CheY-like chemotaxis protein
MEQLSGRTPTTKSESPAHILLIEDNPADVYFMRLALEQQAPEYELRVLSDGAEALRFIEQQRDAVTVDPEPCVIVLDINLPKHDGRQVLRAIKQEPRLAHIHVVVLTTVVSPRDELEVRELGARLYRQKPSDLDEFAEVARHIVEICREGSSVGSEAS